jgi:TPR repeat protein
MHRRLQPIFAAICLALIVTALYGTPALADPHADANANDEKGDYAAELAILQPNADQGQAWAQNNLGILYSAGHGVAQDYAKAVDWYRKAAGQGDAGAEMNLGLAYAKGEGVAQDQAQAEALFRKSAEHGNMQAAFALVASAMPDKQASGSDVEAKAARYRKAGDTGDRHARLMLQLLCTTPTSQVPDCTQVGVWAKASADAGDIEAEKNLASLYETGMMPGIPMDPVLATDWFRKAAEQGDANAQARMGMRYSMGIGVPTNDGQALAWYRKAADQGEMLGEMYLADGYETGKHLPRDPAKAFYWNRKLAGHSDIDAQRKIGMDYALGKGVKQDFNQAYVWLALVVKTDHLLKRETSDADQIALDAVAAHLSAGQLADAKHRVETWEEDPRPARSHGHG